MQVIIWIFFCVLMPLVGITYAIRMLVHFILPRKVADRVTRFVEIPHFVRDADLQQ